jgi:predicted nucleic acid-binding protein
MLLDHGLVAPDLIYAECANVLWKKVRRPLRIAAR